MSAAGCKLSYDLASLIKDYRKYFSNGSFRLDGKFKRVCGKNQFIGKFTAGLQYADSISSGYFYIVNPSRKPEGAANFQVDKQAFRKRNLPFVKALSVQDEKGLVYFLVFYSETKIKDKYPATVTKIYRQEGLSWSINYAFSQLPYELIFSTDTFELTIKTKTSIGEVFPVIFDKAGKVVR